MNSSKDPDFERVKNDDFADAKPVSAFPHLVEHQLERQHRLNIVVDDDPVQWLTRQVSPNQYAQVVNSALREFMKKRAA